MSELAILVSQRKVIRKKVTDRYNCRETYAALTPAQKLSQHSCLSNYCSKLTDLDKQIISIKIQDEVLSDSELEMEVTACQDYQDKIAYCLPLLDTHVNSLPVRVADARSLLKQPTAPLPKYRSARNEDLLGFFSEFESTISSYTYPDRDKLLLLKQQVEGRGSKLLDSLEADKQTYADARALLISAFASEETRKLSTIRQLTDLKLNNNDDPFVYISKLRKICESIKVLQITSDDFSQYFAWHGLDDRFQKEFIQITGKTYPSISSILENFFTACERYEKGNVNLPSPNKTTKVHLEDASSFAVNVTSIKRNLLNCSICTKINGKDANHLIYKCIKFSNPQARLEKLKSFNACTRCSSLEHPTERCNFKFKHRCSHCSKWHFSFLCDRPPMTSEKQNPEVRFTAKPKTKGTTPDTNSGVAVLHNTSGASVLPTFTFKLAGLGTHFRGLKDSGSQNTFISQNLCDKYNFNVLKEDIALTVNGFNGPKSYLTRIVEICIQLGTDEFRIPAIVTPDINVYMKLPLLGAVVSDFISKGYTFADSLLSVDDQELRNIDLLLGTDAAYCLPTRDVIFGKKTNSVFMNSSIGILLLGNVDSLKENLPFLPCPSNDNFICARNSNNLPDFTNVSSVHINTHSFLISDFRAPIIDADIQELEYGNLSSNCGISVLHKGKLVEAKLKEATNQILEAECNNFVNLDQSHYNDETKELDNKLVEFTLRNISREDDGRLRVPLLWNGEVSHLLSHNEHLAKVILHSNFRKLQKNSEQLLMIDQTIKDQLDSGIIGKVENLEQFKSENPDYSFLPHMSIFKPHKETTKCRVVFLSNLKQNETHRKLSLSHNQCIHPGPTLNHKLSSSFLHLRFDKHLLVYDLKKAFNMLSLNEGDQAKLLFFWYRNVRKGDFSLVAYKNMRLSFGLRCSPFLLMVALFYILILEPEESSEVAELKKLMYALIYMDNGAITSMDSNYLQWAYSILPNIFHPYHFDVQQIVTNDFSLQNRIDEGTKSETPVECKLLGLQWDRMRDVVFTTPINLNAEANSKRSILQTIAAQFDLFGFNMPLFNRSRLFMHSLQCQKSLGWDEILPLDTLKMWKNICRQANSSHQVSVDRFVGPRDGSYRILAFTDASNVLYGTVIFLQHLESGNLSFVQAKNRMVNVQLKSKSIPALELNAITLGVETLLDVYRDLSGPTCVKPINVQDLVLYTDSTCSLHWLDASSHLEKMQKRSVFVMNRIHSIQKMCQTHPITFCFIAGNENPADCVTRCLSYKQLSKSNFFTGPPMQLLQDELGQYKPSTGGIFVTLPNPLTKVETGESPSIVSFHDSSTEICVNPTSQSREPLHLIDPNNYSSFRNLVLKYRQVLNCIQKWKAKTGRIGNIPQNNFADASRIIIHNEQKLFFPEIFNYFERKNTKLSDIPLLITQLNIYLDNSGLLRVKSKFKKWLGRDNNFPILLPQHSSITKGIILDAHTKRSHSGAFSVLAEVRPKFYIPKHFSTIKKVLRQCIHCKRFNNRSFKLNQNVYRDFRSDPSKIPFANIFIDHLGPFNTKICDKTQKVWLLILTCTWTRAINLKICKDLSVKEFLRSFQLHCFEFGIPRLCISDSGSQLTAGANMISNFISDPQTQLHFEEHNVCPLQFQQYFKGCNQLGSLVETCVKMTKRLLFGSIKNLVLSYSEFEYLVCYTVHLANRRPIAFKESLRENEGDNIPEPITPEHLIRGYELTSINIIPDLHDIPESDPEWQPDLNLSQQIKDEFSKLRKARSTLIEKYHSEFLGTLVGQAVDRKDRYRPCTQQRIKPGDIVLMKENFTKPSNYPMAMVKKLYLNSNNEVTGADVLKGKTRELLKRHITALIPFLEFNSPESSASQSESSTRPSSLKGTTKVKRKAALDSEQRTRQMLSH